MCLRHEQAEHTEIGESVEESLIGAPRWSIQVLGLQFLARIRTERLGKKSLVVVEDHGIPLVTSRCGDRCFRPT